MQPRLVVVVENDTATRKALGRVLHVGGFEPALYRSAEEFLNSPPTLRPVCLVIDVHLGEMSGLDLQKRLKRLGSNLPVIVMTAFDDPELRAEAHRAGCAGYLDKESDAQQLLDLIQSL